MMRSLWSRRSTRNCATGLSRADAVHAAVGEIFAAAAGIDADAGCGFHSAGVSRWHLTGVFFRALAVTMAVALLASLMLALTLTPALAAWIIRARRDRSKPPPRAQTKPAGGFFCARSSASMKSSSCSPCGIAGSPSASASSCSLPPGGNTATLDSNDFLPAMDEGGFVIDYIAPPGISLTEINRQMLQAEKILSSVPEIESYSRRTRRGTGRAPRRAQHRRFSGEARGRSQARSTEAVIADVRAAVQRGVAAASKWEFPRHPQRS